MNISQKTLTTLEFDKIREMLAALCPTEGASQMARALYPDDRGEIVARRQRRTTDARRLVDAKGVAPFGTVHDMGDICERALKGAVLTPRELLDAAALLRSARNLLDYKRANHLFDTSLDEIFERLLPNHTLEDRIFRAIISEDMIADEASPTLADIRRKIRASNSKIKEALSKYLSGSYSKYLQENIVTQRNGRYVVPVKAEHRNDVKGLIHDTSSSGATVFVEPMAVVEANNELRVLEVKEQVRKEEADSLFSQNFFLLLGVGLVISVAVLILREPFAKLLGADEVTLEYVKQYLLGLAPFSACFIISSVERLPSSLPTAMLASERL